MKKRVLSLALVALMLLALLPTGAGAASSDFVIQDGVLTLYKGSGGAVTIPSGVTEIGNNAFSGCTGLTAVVIPDGVTEIGYRAFYECVSLNWVTFPSSLTYIEKTAFDDTLWMEKQGDLVVANGVLFKYRGTSSSVVIPNWVTSIGDFVFRNNTSLKSVMIPSSVTSIGKYAFYGCTKLASVTIPGSVKNIEEEAFRDCTGLNSVTISNGVTSIGENAFYGCTKLTSVTIPNSVTSIEYGAFAFCENLKSLVIPHSVTEMTAFSFANTAWLRAQAQSGFVVVNGILLWYQGTETFLTIPNGVTRIGDRAFNHNTSLKSVTIPHGVQSIGAGAFENCTGLKMVTIPDSVTSIGDRAFSGCKNLTSVTIPSSVTSIADWAFSGCTNLTSVTIPSSVTSIGEYAFSGTPWLKAQGDFAIAGRVLVKYKGNASAVTIPSSVTSIGGGAFSGCTSLTSVTIPNSVTIIGYRAFSDCSSLTDIYYGGSEAQWKAIKIGSDNAPLTRAKIHYNSAVAGAPTAYASTQTVRVDGKKVEFPCYALKDANGNDTNYVKLRDVASVLSGTGARFDVGWDGAVNIETGKAYTPNGSEMSTPFSGDRIYKKASSGTKINGFGVNLDAIVLTDDAGNGYTYYKLRDLGAWLGFTVDWSAEKGIFIETK